MSAMGWKALGFDSYDEYLRSDHWIGFREKYKQSDCPQMCCLCGDPKFQLHHVTYDRVGSEELSDVMPLCSNHHEHVHYLLETMGLPVEESHRVVKLIERTAADAIRQVQRESRNDDREEQKRRESERETYFRSALREFLRLSEEFDSVRHLSPTPLDSVRGQLNETVLPFIEKAIVELRGIISRDSVSGQTTCDESPPLAPKTIKLPITPRRRTRHP